MFEITEILFIKRKVSLEKMLSIDEMCVCFE